MKPHLKKKIWVLKTNKLGVPVLVGHFPGTCETWTQDSAVKKRTLTQAETYLTPVNKAVQNTYSIKSETHQAPPKPLLYPLTHSLKERQTDTEITTTGSANTAEGKPTELMARSRVYISLLPPQEVL